MRSTDPSSAAALLAERAARYRDRKADTSRAGEREYLFFHRAGARYGVLLHGLRAVEQDVALTPLPGLRGVVIGLANVRGRVVAVHDLAAYRRRGPRSPLPERPVLLVAEREGREFALLADDVGEPRRLAPEDLREPPIALDFRRGTLLGIHPGSAGSLPVAVLDLAGLARDDSFFRA